MCGLHTNALETVRSAVSLKINRNLVGRRRLNLNSERTQLDPRNKWKWWKECLCTLSFQPDPASLSFSEEVKNLQSFRGSEPLYPEEFVENIKLKPIPAAEEEGPAQPLELVKRTKARKTTDELTMKTAGHRSKVVAETRTAMSGGAADT
ncbi:uncharacterized protein LOC113668330 [Pocillopora damicornis]|uniref:uncharacterized protein LOC113668330 n=1 Tax=Pocillopora damicornis TaxID=46731 RepID=UPI000F54D1C4|nr:uncharacterized protein LOC113668330 [Pocillopora damicornis]